ncbi:MAG TPA: site-2 protease family protein [Acidothermaceae bacterium]|jgi:membrane-associated protease RseP (regulator of RpoE activity)
MMAIGVVAFVVALLTSVMLHEAGHFLTAKLFGMKATQFFVGFGTTLWSTQKGETEYGVKAIPAGGFVKIIGMTPLEEVAAEDAPRAFINKPGWQRLIVLVAGSTMHFILALVLLFSLAVGWRAHDTGNARIAKVFACAAPDPNGNCPAGSTPPPAAGVLQSGDVIVAVNGRAVNTAVVPDLTTGAKPGTTVKGGDGAAISMIKSASGPINLTVMRHGSEKDLTLNPVVIDGVRRVGIGTEPDFVRVGPVAGVGYAFSAFGQNVTGTFGALGKVPHAISNIFSTHPPKRTVGDSGASVTSVVGVARIAGEGFASGGVGGGTGFLLGLIASVNIFVGIFNLFPFLPLDGGHVAILGYEKLRNAWRRRRHLIAAGPVDLNKLMPFTYGVLVIIVAISALILFADVSNPVANPFN